MDCGTFELGYYERNRVGKVLILARFLPIPKWGTGIRAGVMQLNCIRCYYRLEGQVYKIKTRGCIDFDSGRTYNEFKPVYKETKWFKIYFPCNQNPCPGAKALRTAV